jgi:hypothetical protein
MALTGPRGLQPNTIIATQMMSSTTIYLSTLSSPIEPLEELIATTAITSSLLSWLQCTIKRFEAGFNYIENTGVFLSDSKHTAFNKTHGYRKPNFQHSPSENDTKSQYRNCAGPGFTNIRRLK